MYQLLSLFTFSIFAQENIPFNPISPLNITVSGESVSFQWEILEKEYEYKVEVLKGSRCNSVKIASAYTTEDSILAILPSDGEYCWRLKYRRVDTEEFQISDLYPFSYMKDPPEEESEESIDENLPDQEDEDTKEEEPKTYIEEEIIEDESVSISPLEANKDIQIKKTQNFPNDQNIQNPIVIAKEEEVLGIAEEKEEQENSIKTNPSLKCSLIYDKSKKKYTKTDCEFEFPNITVVKRYEIDDDFDYVIVKGDLVKNLELEILILDCEKFSLFKPSTWFKCKKKEESKDISIPLLYSPTVKIKGKRSTISTYDLEENTFLLKIFSEKLNNENISLTFDIYFYVNIYDDWLDFRDSIEKKLDYSLGVMVSEEEEDRPLRYLFSRIIGVTQWHGYTSYDSPHTGIDFGSIKEKILSPVDGTISAIGWDSYYGKCNSGGKYLKIKHENGMYTVYMHLESYINEEGDIWNVGDHIKKGQQLGISGNTGAYNCQPLGYHLHYELRKDSKQSTHTDPVPYTNIDWNLIPTLNWQTYPGRLSGDNPHPNF